MTGHCDYSPYEPKNLCSWGSGGRGVKLITYLHLVLRWRMSGAIPLLPYMLSWRDDGQLYLNLSTSSSLAPILSQMKTDTLPSYLITRVCNTGCSKNNYAVTRKTEHIVQDLVVLSRRKHSLYEVTLWNRHFAIKVVCMLKCSDLDAYFIVTSNTHRIGSPCQAWSFKVPSFFRFRLHNPVDMFVLCRTCQLSISNYVHFCSNIVFASEGNGHRKLLSVVGELDLTFCRLAVQT